MSSDTSTPETNETVASSQANGRSGVFSDWQMLRGIIATSAAAALGGAIGIIVGGFGDKGKAQWTAVRLGGRASRFGGIGLATMFGLIAGRASFATVAEEAHEKKPVTPDNLPARSKMEHGMTDAPIVSEGAPKMQIVPRSAELEGAVHAATYQQQAV